MLLKNNSICLIPIVYSDLLNVARIHLRAFPESALSKLGLEAIRRYYEWQLNGPHDVDAWGVSNEDRLVGFCFSGIFRGAFSGFIQKNRWFLAWSVIKNPALFRNVTFRHRLSSAIKCISRKSQPSKVRPSTKSPTSYGILSIAVDPDYHGMGIGKALMEHCEKLASQKGFNQMRLTVNPGNTKAIRFYEHLGWKKDMIEELWKGCMIKTLNQKVLP